MTEKVLHRQCLLCSQALRHEISLKQILTFKPLSFPAICFKCNQEMKLISQTPYDCSSCRRQLDPHSGDIYHQIYRPQGEVEDKQYCWDCKRWLDQYPAYFLNHQAIYQYSEKFRKFIHQYKYLGDYRLAQIVKEQLIANYQKYSDYQWLILPSSAESQRERQFHATASMLKEAGIPYHSIFQYQGDGKRQARKNRQDRLALKQAFKILESSHPLLEKYQNWLIFDDIYTTGATILRAKESLFSYYQQEKWNRPEIISLSLARDNL